MLAASHKAAASSTLARTAAPRPVGHDWGGLIAWAFALIYPEQLRKLVITTASHPALLDRAMRENREQQEASQFTLLLAEDGIEEQLAADEFRLLADAVLGFDFLTEDDRAAYRRAWSQEDALRAMVDYYRVSDYLPPHDGRPGFGDYAPEFRDKTIEVPTLVVYAEGSPYARRATLAGLEDFVPDLRLHPVPSRTHQLHEENPTLVNGLISDFLAEGQREQATVSMLAKAHVQAQANVTSVMRCYEGS